jgi:hypothetical protein
MEKGNQRFRNPKVQGSRFKGSKVREFGIESAEAQT